MTQIQNTDIPAGFRKDAKGRLVPESVIKPIDLARDELVMSIIAQAKVAARVVADFRARAFADIAAFVQLSAEQYDARLGGEKGNVTLTSFDGSYKVLRAIQEKQVFDERLQAAKTLIESCLHRWSAGATPEIQALVNDAFQVDQEGNINMGRVLGLRRLDFKDDEWQRAMEAISDSLQVVGSKSFVRIYERDADGEYKALSFDVAGARS